MVKIAQKLFLDLGWKTLDYGMFSIMCILYRV